MASDQDRAEYQEGPDAAKQFEHTINRVLKVSKEELTRREAEHQKTRPAKKTRPRS